MNERIRDLAVQAHVYADGHSLLCHEGDIKKFAELIVRECAKIADDGFASSNFGNGITGDQLKKHFGVEE